MGQLESNPNEQNVTSQLYPVEWLPYDSSTDGQIVLALTALLTTGNSFGANIDITSAGGTFSNTVTLSYQSGFTSVYLGMVQIPAPSSSDPIYPLTISADISCSTSFTYVASSQHAIGQKVQGGNTEVLSYQAGVFCNDVGSDNDWNDLVLTYQLFSQSDD